MQSADVQKLRYASPDLFKRRLPSPILIGLLLLVLFLFTRRVGPGLYYSWMRAREQQKLIRVQEECLHYTAPPTQVVYEEDLAAAESLLKQGPEYLLVVPRRTFFQIRPEMLQLRHFSVPDKPMFPVIAHIPRCWEDYVYRMDDSKPVLFLHEL